MEGLIDRHGNADVTDNRRLLLQLCCNNTLCIMNTFFQHRDLQKYAQCGDYFEPMITYWFLRTFQLTSSVQC